MSSAQPYAPGNRSTSSNQTATTGISAEQARTRPDSRSPTANITLNPNAEPAEPAQFQEGDQVWVLRDTENRYYNATVHQRHWNGSEWTYILIDGQQQPLWQERVVWIAEDKLSSFG
ncbi:hypothetical protein CC78DRAFT_613083 [Lojkania enalia]|uniref:Uncharacterized protein n=1 Tax=Lojkania enalia TaxID=147567 RepID=A0A9P4KJT6_9PLEO|nr:hypothetical protein CC78DRAFT_613083 [Didymosphaeria enalia]